MKSEAHLGTPPMEADFFGATGAGGATGAAPNEKDGKLKAFLAGAAAGAEAFLATGLAPTPRGLGICRADVEATKAQMTARMAMMDLENIVISCASMTARVE